MAATTPGASQRERAGGPSYLKTADKMVLSVAERVCEFGIHHISTDPCVGGMCWNEKPFEDRM